MARLGNRDHLQLAERLLMTLCQGLRQRMSAARQNPMSSAPALTEVSGKDLRPVESSVGGLDNF